MSRSELLEMVEQGHFAEFDNRCLEMISEGTLSPKELAGVLERLRDAGEKERVASLMPMVIEALDWDSADAQGILSLAKAAIACDPKNAELRDFLVKAYTKAYSDVDGFDSILTASGLTAGRPFRNACKTMDLGMTLKVGDFLVNSMDDNAAEVVEIDRPNALFTLRRESRTTTTPATEMARDFEPVDTNDFRVLRQLQPERLPELVEQDPVALVVGLIHAHGDHIDQDRLHDELVPRYLSKSEWSKWWSKTRTKLKRSRHIVMEGRAPVMISYSREGQSLEDELLESFEAGKEPKDWQKAIEDYLKEKKAHKEEPDEPALKDLRGRLEAHLKRVRDRRPAEALATALVLEHLQSLGLPGDESLATSLIQDADEPVKLIAALPETAQWTQALAVLQQTRPEEHPHLCAALFGKAPATLLDQLATAAAAGGELNAVQKWIEKALDQPVKYPEIIYWLWKGPAKVEGLRLPEDNLLFDELIGTALALGRTLEASAAETREFRQRIRQALGLRGGAKAERLVAATPFDKAVTLKSQLLRLEGFGENVRNDLLNVLRDTHPQLWVKAAAKRLEPWQRDDVLFATAAGVERRTAERDQIVNVDMRENAKRIGEAAALGDLSENSEYKFALEERDLLRARLADINGELSIAEALQPDDVPSDHVGIGSRVVFREKETGETRTVTFLGPFDTDVEAGVYNYKAPFSQKVLGLRIGESGTVTLDGKDLELEVVSIENALRSE